MVVALLCRAKGTHRFLEFWKQSISIQFHFTLGENMKPSFTTSAIIVYYKIANKLFLYLKVFTTAKPTIFGF